MRDKAPRGYGKRMEEQMLARSHPHHLTGARLGREAGRWRALRQAGLTRILPIMTPPVSSSCRPLLQMTWQVRVVKMAIQYVVLLRWDEIRSFAALEHVSWFVSMQPGARDVYVILCAYACVCDAKAVRAEQARRVRFVQRNRFVHRGHECARKQVRPVVL